ncbi:DUF2935 domain-containing protein [Paenibacillus nanensis]|uniref:DUF2935 domain-containing protein n=1 Tax=Paenibacillus nanensis TaxID=393251 RepID=A0A3A1UUL6_9BACL|nr:DUF2935 domain-containing protein [Paenibacillus nanensis]RIX50872.1 DUF2935 domain-containing protein [Paenibacillus nanensis]
MEEQAWFEHRFWLQILGDHSRFIHSALAPKEKRDVQLAEQFIQLFDQLLEQARSEQASLAEVTASAYRAAEQLKAFKLDLLDRLLLGKVTIAFTPTFLNHMVNELEEYMRILASLLEGKGVPVFPSLHHDLLWLPDASGHAATIAAELDPTEKNIIKKSEQFEKHFNQFYLKAIELAGYFRTMRDHYPAMSKFHTDVNLEMAVFMAFLQELEELEISNELLSRIDPLMPDHMFREECYYLLKLSQSGAAQQPDCDPAKPRLS